MKTGARRRRCPGDAAAADHRRDAAGPAASRSEHKKRGPGKVLILCAYVIRLSIYYARAMFARQDDRVRLLARIRHGVRRQLLVLFQGLKYCPIYKSVPGVAGRGYPFARPFRELYAAGVIMPLIILLYRS